MKVLTVVTVVTKNFFFSLTKHLFFTQKTVFQKKIHKKIKCDKTQKLKMLQNSRPQNVTKHKNYKCDKTQYMTKLRL